MTRSLVIVNPHASRMRRAGAVERAAAHLASVLTARDGAAPWVVIPTTPEATAGHVQEALSAGAPCVVGVGGDGTLKEIASVLAGTGVPLGIVPGGTGNILAGVLGVPGNISAAIAALATARPRALDLGQVTLEFAAPTGSGSPAPAAATALGAATTRSFAIGCGLGFDARVMSETHPDLKRRFGRLAYFARAAVLATRMAAVPYRVTVDGERFETEASIAMVANMGELLPGLVGPRLAIVPDDGLLDVFVVGARGPVAGMRGLVDHLRRTEFGANEAVATLRVRGRQVRVESTPPEPMQVDGDAFGPGALEAVIRPGAMVVLVPPGSIPQSSRGGARLP